MITKRFNYLNDSACLTFKQPETVINVLANQWTGFYMITASVMKGLKRFSSKL